MDVSILLRDARIAAGLSQTELAERSGTSQTALSAYERGRKTPSASTLGRILAASGHQLGAVRASRPVRTPSAKALKRSGATLLEVLELAALLPTRHDNRTAFPGLPRPPLVGP